MSQLSPREVYEANSDEEASNNLGGASQEDINDESFAKESGSKKGSGKKSGKGKGKGKGSKGSKKGGSGKKGSSKKKGGAS